MKVVRIGIAKICRNGQQRICAKVRRGMSEWVAKDVCARAGRDIGMGNRHRHTHIDFGDLSWSALINRSTDGSVDVLSVSRSPGCRRNFGHGQWALLVQAFIQRPAPTN